MGLANALTSSLSGLRTTQTGLQLVSSNIANAQTPGYTKKNATLQTNVVAGSSAGVRVSEIRREIDTYVQRQLRTESSGLSFSGVTSGYLDSLQRLFGTPGSDASLDSLVGGFTNALDALATTPSSQSARQDALNQARLLAQSLNAMSNDIQALREDADRGLQDTVDRANAALQGIQSVSARIAATGAGDTVPPDLLDQRDNYVRDLAQIMDIRVNENGNALTIYTGGGAMLFSAGRASSLRFEGSGQIMPQSLYGSNAAESALGTVILEGDGGSTDLLGGSLLRSGEMKAYAEMRDNMLVEAQTQIDELAAAMAEALGTNTVAGTAAGTGFSVDLAALQPGNQVSVTYAQPPGGPSRTVTFIRTDDPATLPLSDDVTADPRDRVVGINFSGGHAAAAAQMNAALGANFTVASAGSTFTFDQANASVDVTAVSARTTATALSGQGVALPFFVDSGAANGAYTGSLDGVAQRLGFASRISVNPALLDDPSLLVGYASGIPSGDATRAAFLRDALQNTSLKFRGDTGLGGTNSPFTGSIADYARGVIETQGRNAELAARVNEGQQVVVTSLEDRFDQRSSVDVEEEMAKLLQLQTAYSANARVVSTVKEMIDVLLRM